MIHLKAAKLIHYVAVAVLGWAASRGFHALLAEGLDRLVGEAMAVALALCVGGMLSISLCHWRTDRVPRRFPAGRLFVVLSLGISLPLCSAGCAARMS